MKPIFHPRLVNDVFGDPGLLVEFLYEKRALLFDLGEISAIPNGTLLKVSDVFVSHTHIDHFVGFDRLLRIVFGRGKTLRLYGPSNFIANVEGKLAGFTWNLVDRYSESITLEVTEVHEDHLRRARFRAIDRFKRTEERREPFAGGPLLEEPAFSVHAAVLEHRVPCLGFALKEMFHVNIRKEQLEARKLPHGAWLNDLKRFIFEGKPDDFLVEVPCPTTDSMEFVRFPLGQLKEDLVLLSPGQKIAYVVDTVYNQSNKPRIIDLVRGADLFFCESPFLAEEEERGLERCHLTSRQAGLLAGEAGVRQLRTFHFSPKHMGRKLQLQQEAQDAFREAGPLKNTLV
ncbi:MAG: ribonuclease Z [Nitrospinaceae bacterium]|nr:MAG: ribonuclease Z [Nitrospinaceae bacterium]